MTFNPAHTSLGEVTEFTISQALPELDPFIKDIGESKIHFEDIPTESEIKEALAEWEEKKPRSNQPADVLKRVTQTIIIFVSVFLMLLFLPILNTKDDNSILSATVHAAAEQAADTADQFVQVVKLFVKAVIEFAQQILQTIISLQSNAPASTSPPGNAPPAIAQWTFKTPSSMLPSEATAASDTIPLFLMTPQATNISVLAPLHTDTPTPLATVVSTVAPSLQPTEAQIPLTPPVEEPTMTPTLLSMGYTTPSPTETPASISIGYTTPSPTTVATLQPTATSTPIASPTETTSTFTDFWVDSSVIDAGECITLYWIAKGVRAIYLDSEGIAGPQGERTICPTVSTIYTFHVVQVSGQAEFFPIQVQVLSPTSTNTPTSQPTNTPTPLLTDTPIPAPTITATSQPTNTPTPLPTDTSIPTQTDTPEPQPTNTPTSLPTNTPGPTVTPVEPITILISDVTVCAKGRADSECTYEYQTAIDGFIGGTLSVEGEILRDSGDKQINESVQIMIADQEVVSSQDGPGQGDEPFGPETLNLSVNHPNLIIRHLDDSEKPKRAGSVTVNIRITFIPGS